MESLYAHMVNAPTLTVGSTIKQGTVVGRVGDSGNADGIHLHLEIFKNGNLVNPLDYLTEDSSKNGWYREDGSIYGTHYYYFYPDGMWDGTRGQLMTGWHDIYDNGELRYFYPDGMWDGTRGQLMIGWQKVDGEWRYFYENGEYEGEKGMMHTYWLTRDGKKYFCDPTTGIRQTGL